MMVIVPTADLVLSWKRLIVACCVATIAAAAATVANSADPATTQCWAIVAIDDESQAAGDLLTVRLGHTAGVELVERAAIQAVLAEQQLAAGGLAEPTRSLQLGRLLGADALILIDQPAKTTPQQLRIRLVEVATGAHLLHAFVAAADLASAVATAGKELEHAQRTLAIPAAERRYVGVAGVRTEESGELLDAHGRLLRAFLEADLGRIDSVVVLEREQVHRLVTEAQLTGAEQRLRASTWLIEAGLRRDAAGGGYRVSGNLHTLVDDTGKSFQVAIPDDLLIARGILARAVAAQLDATLATDAVADRANEAELFARKRDWYAHAWRDHDAQEMGEAAAALAPTKDNVMRLLGLYYAEARGKDGRLETHGALLAAKRYHEARLRWLQQSSSDPELFQRVLHESMYAFQPAIRYGIGEEPEEDAQLRGELNQLTMQLFDLAWRELKDDHETKRKVWSNAMSNAFSIARSWEEYLAILDKLQALFIEELGGSPEQFEASLLQHHQRSSTRSSVKWLSADLAQRGKFQARMQAAAGLAASDENVMRRVQGLKLRMGLPGDEGAEAARGIVAALFPRPPDAPPLGHIQQQHNDALMYSAYRRLEQVGEAGALYERILRTAEKEQDAELLAYWSVTVHLGFVHFPNEKKLEPAARITAVLDRAEAADFAATRIRGLRHNITKVLTERGLLAPPAFSTEDAPGAWKDFVTTPIPIEKLPDRFQLWQVLFDKRPEAAARDEQLVLVWARRFKTLSIERVSLRGGTPRKIGPDISGFPAAFHGLNSAIGSDGTVYVASETPGIFAVSETGVESIGPAEGAPGGRVQAMAWLGGKLYVTFENIFSAYDPTSKRFELLASAAAVQPRNPLDGGVGYFIFELVADADNHCLWFNLQANTADVSRGGVWRYEPQADRFTQVFKSVPKASLSESLIFVVNKENMRWSEIDRKTGTIKPLTGYDGKEATPPSIPGELTMLRIGGNIIDVYGRLFTPDGHVHEMIIEAPWPYLQHAGTGFLTHFDHRKNTLWMVTPREHTNAASPNAARD